MEESPADRVGQIRARTDVPTARSSPTNNCYCTWQLCPLGPDGESCIVFLRVGGGWCHDSCSDRHNVVARVNASAARRRAAAGLEDPPLNSPGGHPPRLVSSSGDNP